MAKLPPDIQKRLELRSGGRAKAARAERGGRCAGTQALAARTRLLDDHACKVWGRIVQVRPGGVVAESRRSIKCAPAAPRGETVAAVNTPSGLAGSPTSCKPPWSVIAAPRFRSARSFHRDRRHVTGVGRSGALARHRLARRHLQLRDRRRPSRHHSGLHRFARSRDQALAGKVHRLREGFREGGD